MGNSLSLSKAIPCGITRPGLTSSAPSTHQLIRSFSTTNGIPFTCV